MQEIEKRAKEMEELNENLFSKSFRWGARVSMSAQMHQHEPAGDGVLCRISWHLHIQAGWSLPACMHQAHGKGQLCVC